MSQYIEPREIVQSFARRMEERLRANDNKGGWRSDSPRSLLIRLREEVQELADELAGGPDLVDEEAVAREAADVANFAMMVADVCNALTPEPLDEQGRQHPAGYTS